MTRRWFWSTERRDSPCSYGVHQCSYGVHQCSLGVPQPELLSNAPSVYRMILLFVFMTVLVGCGRFGSPLPPESFAPAAVQELQIEPSVDGIKFAWRSPKEDRRGMELEDLSYFEVRRAQTEDLVSFLKDPLRASEVVGRMYDPTGQLIKKEREAARAEKKPARKIKAADTLVAHEFLDEAVEPNTIYIYSIVPYTEDGVAGEVAQYVRVVFSGLTSKVEMLDVAALNRPYILDF